MHCKCMLEGFWCNFFMSNTINHPHTYLGCSPSVYNVVLKNNLRIVLWILTTWNNTQVPQYVIVWNHIHLITSRTHYSFIINIHIQPNKSKYPFPIKIQFFFILKIGHVKKSFSIKNNHTTEYMRLLRLK